MCMQQLPKSTDIEVKLQQFRLDLITFNYSSLMILTPITAGASTHDVATTATEPIDSTKIQPLDSAVKPQQQ